MGKVKLAIIMIMGFLITSIQNGDPSALQCTKLNVLYLGLENPISIRHPKIACDDLVLKLSPDSLGTVTQLGCGNYSINLHRRNREGVHLLVYHKKVSKRRLLYKSIFRTLKAPSPVASLAKKEGGYVSSEFIKASKKLSVDIPNFVYAGIQYEIVSFDYIYKPKKGNVLRGTNSGAHFRSKLLSACQIAKAGDLFVISGISAKDNKIGTVLIPGQLVFHIN